MRITELQKALADASSKVEVTIVNRWRLYILFGSEPDDLLVEALVSLEENKCFTRQDEDTQQKQKWTFHVAEPQDGFKIGVAISKDLVNKGLDVEINLIVGENIEDAQIKVICGSDAESIEKAIAELY